MLLLIKHSLPLSFFSPFTHSHTEIHTLKYVSTHTHAFKNKYTYAAIQTHSFKHIHGNKCTLTHKKKHTVTLIQDQKCTNTQEHTHSHTLTSTHFCQCIRISHTHIPLHAHIYTNRYLQDVLIFLMGK